MNIYEALAWDHTRISVLLSRIERTEPHARDQREQLFSRVKDVLGPHQSFEEEIFYPELLESQPVRKQVLDAYEEHREAGRILVELEGLDVSLPAWIGGIASLKAHLERGMHGEETGIFRKAGRFLGPDQGQLLADRYRQHLRRFEPDEEESASGAAQRTSASAAPVR